MLIIFAIKVSYRLEALLEMWFGLRISLVSFQTERNRISKQFKSVKKQNKEKDLYCLPAFYV